MEEPVPEVPLPEYWRQPFFDVHFAAPAAAPFSGRFAPIGDPTRHVSVASGDGNVYVSSEIAGRVAVYDAKTLALLRTLSHSGLERPRGVASYRGEVYVVDSNDSEVFVFDPLSQQLKRRLKHPANLAHGQATLLTGVKLSGIDVAWNEIWLTFQASSLGGGVTALDAGTGLPKSVTWHLPRYDCSANPNDLAFGNPDFCTERAHAGVGAAATCRVELTGWIKPRPPDHVGDPPGEAELNSCVAAVTPKGDDGRHDWWDVATAPEVAGLLAQCRMINRAPLLGVGLDDVAADELLRVGDCARHQNGIDEVWGMRWLLEVSGDNATAPGKRVTEYEVADDNPNARLSSVRRTWAPMDAASNNQRDIAYNHRETRIDWDGHLARSEWLRGSKCVDYVVSDADIFVVGHRGERWYELARGFQQIEFFLDNTATPADENLRIGTQTTNPGQFCYATNLVASGTYRLKAVATVLNGAKQVTVTNPELRLDNTAPGGALNSPGALVTGTVTLSGNVTDAHSGPKEWRVELQPAGGSFGALCSGAVTNPAVGYSCDWDTRTRPDGPYNLRTFMRDSVKPENGDGNTAHTPVVSTRVDNNPPTVQLGGALFDAQDRRPLYPDEPAGLDVNAGDGAGSGVKSIEVLVDGVRQHFAEQGCPGGACTMGRGFSLGLGGFADGEHNVQVIVRDHIGFTTTRDWWVDVEHDMPAAGAGASTPRAAADPEQVPTDLLPCPSPGDQPPFGVFSLGSSFEGLALEFLGHRCDAVAYPGELVRANFVTHIYGDCTAPDVEDDASCTPPLEVQSWPACERNPSVYIEGPGLGLVEFDNTTVRGAPAAVFDHGHRIEVFTGTTNVVIFGRDPAQVRRAADALLQEPAAVPLGQLGLASPLFRADPLPAPPPGTVDGQLTCDAALRLASSGAATVEEAAGDGARGADGIGRDGVTEIHEGTARAR
jgi:hypothetical protein